MSGIPYVRHVEPTDDGCAVYQCLMCKNQWESRTAPSYDWADIPEWKFCPYCGCQWEGQKKWDEKKKWDERRGKYHLAASERSRTERLRPLKFKIQKRYIPPRGEEAGCDQSWQLHRMGCPSAPQAWEYLQQLRAEEDETDEELADVDFGSNIYRAVPDGEFIKWKEL